jgi:hypothetical protein
MRKGILEELNKSSITVTDLANQSWCEYKVYLSCTQKEKQTYAMRAGEAVHMNLQKEVYKELSVEPVNYPDVIYKNAYESIMTMNSVIDNGKGRELKIEGDIDGFTIRGKIDELIAENGQTVIVENKTVNGSSGAHNNAIREMHSVQAMVYRLMLKNIIEKRYTFKKYYDSNRISGMKLSPQFIQGLKDIGMKEDMINIGAICLNMFEAYARLPKISDDLIIRYIDRESKSIVEEVRLKYDHAWLSKILQKDLLFWNKQKAPEPVPKEESWRCRSCYFLKIKKCSFGISYLS